MRRSAPLCALVLTLSIIGSPALARGQATPTADEIIARYVQRVGGAERLSAVLSVRRSGKFYGGGGFEAVVTNENRRPNKVREEFTFGGLTGVTAFDGKAGWKIEPWGGKKDAEPLGEDETKGIVEDAEFDDPLFNYKERGNTAALIGTDQIEGTDVYKLQLTLASNGDVRTYYLDAESCVPIKYEVKRTVRGAERWFEVELGDYKEVQGVLFPFAVAIGAKGSASADKQQFVWERITVNPVLDDRRFTRPAAGEKLVTADAAQQGTAGPSPASLPAPPPLAAARGAAAAPPSVDSGTISGLGARNIGSAVMSGRVTSVAAVHEGDRLTVYVGAASGGVWKSMNGGTTFTPVFDKQDVMSIGAIAIDPKDSKTIWVGTGESWMRNSVSLGDGIYKTTDGGETWTNMGLASSEHIAKILIDPTTSSTVYACVPGKAFSDSDDRGVYRTTDGGKSWTKVLSGANPSTGCSLMTMNPASPKTLYAGMWDFRRKGWTFRSGGDGPDKPSASGLFRSTDGGTTWLPLDDKSTKGLPAKPVGACCRRRRAIQAQRRLCVHRGGAAAQRAVSLRGRRCDVGAPRSQPEHAVASVLLRQPDRRSQGREPCLQAGRLAHHEHRRRRVVLEHQR
jgi:hypothetical protein